MTHVKCEFPEMCCVEWDGKACGVIARADFA